MIEPVIESLIQLLVQSILVYIVLGPNDSTGGITGHKICPFFSISHHCGIYSLCCDISSLLFESTPLHHTQLAHSTIFFYTTCPVPSSRKILRMKLAFKLFGKPLPRLTSPQCCLNRQQSGSSMSSSSPPPASLSASASPSGPQLILVLYTK